MLQLHLLMTEVVPPIPDDVKVLQDFGEVSIVSDGEFITGTHVAVECGEPELRSWLGPLDGYWLGVGQPFQQQFHIVHLGEKNE